MSNDDGMRFLQSEETLGDNMAPQYSMDFPAAFVSIAFTTILLLLTVFAVSVAMWHIDPGRDSIIYRLTSQKIKKDQWTVAYSLI